MTPRAGHPAVMDSESKPPRPPKRPYVKPVMAVHAMPPLSVLSTSAGYEEPLPSGGTLPGGSELDAAPRRDTPDDWGDMW